MTGGFLKDCKESFQETVMSEKSKRARDSFSFEFKPTDFLTKDGSENGGRSKAQNVITTLDKLPNVKKLVLHHSPVAPDDAHLEHLVNSFPGVTQLRVDFRASDRGPNRITGKGLRCLSRMPLTHLTIENADTFSGEVLAVLTSIKTLKYHEVFTAKGSRTSEDKYRALLVQFEKLRPEINVSYVNR